MTLMPDGKSFITASGTVQSEIWIHNDKTGDRPITSEGYASSPWLSPDRKKVYYLRRTSGAHSYFSGELWVSEVKTGAAERLFPGIFITQFALSQDGKKILFATEQGQAHSGLWIAGLDRTQAPQQLTSGGEYRAFFGRPGEIVYQGGQDLARLMRMNEDGSGQHPAADLPIVQLESVSPDGRWTIVGMTPPEGHGDRAIKHLAVPLDGGEPFTVCDNCASGFGTARFGAPLLLWGQDGKWLYIKLRLFGYSVDKTAAIPTHPGDAPSVIKDMKDEAAVLRLPGARVILAEEVFPMNSPDYYVSVRKSAKTNLFRIYLQP